MGVIVKEGVKEVSRVKAGARGCRNISIAIQQFHLPAECHVFDAVSKLRHPPVPWHGVAMAFSK
jgi:hypothetical protein